MKSLELVGTSGINEKSRGIKDRGKIYMEIIWGAKVQKTKLLGGKLTSHLWPSGRSPRGSRIASR